MRNKLFHYPALVCAAFIWASNNIAGAWLTRDVDPVTANLLRTSLATLIYVPILLYYRRKTRLSGAHKMRLVLASVCLALFFQLFYLALWMTSASHVAILLALGPAVTSALAAPYLGEKLSPTFVAGLTLALISAFTLGWLQAQGTDPSAGFTGGLVAFAAMLAFAHYTLLSKPLLRQYPGPYILGVVTSIGTALLWLLTPVMRFDWHAVRLLSVEHWLALVYIALFMNLISYTLYYAALRRLPAAVTHSTTVYVTTVFALIMARTVLGEPIPLLHWCLAGLITVGVGVTVWTPVQNRAAVVPRSSEQDLSNSKDGSP